MFKYDSKKLLPSMMGLSTSRKKLNVLRDVQ